MNLIITLTFNFYIMKKLFTLIVSIMILLGTSIEAFADTWVNGYYKKNGTYVQGHWRSDRNGSKYDNWSTKGNYNPYTGKAGTHKVDGYSNYNYYTPSYNSYNNYNSYTPSYYNSYSTPTYNYSNYNKKTCSDTYGIMSIENLDGTCSCLSGYTFGKDNQCVSKTKYCQENHGYGATYNSLNDQCECSYGYEVKNNQCAIKENNYNTKNKNDNQEIKIAIGILNSNTNLRKQAGTEGEIIKVIKKGEYIYYVSSQKVKIGNHYWTTVMTSDKEVGYMITDTIDFIEDYN
ncbi:hypothetical protein DLH72_01165 [Candidatus Gracilibacteria bacterium]|nr:MAG: hypothetical protein DLH72_01165 [Candidatus Gracilibacteria bacterium]